MKFKKLIFLVLGIGIISSIAVIYFYILQRDFTKYHREFLLSVNTLENTNTDLRHFILQSSIYYYNNQDKVASTSNLLEKEYEKHLQQLIHLKKSEIFQFF